MLTVPPVIVTDLNSPEAQFAEHLLEQYGVQAFGATVVPNLSLIIATNPGVSDNSLVSDEDGTMKHLVRGKIGWMVDFVWPFVSQYVDLAIRQAVPEARAAAESFPPLPTPAPAEAIVPNA